MNNPMYSMHTFSCDYHGDSYHVDEDCPTCIKHEDIVYPILDAVEFERKRNRQLKAQLKQLQKDYDELSRQI